MKTLNLTIDLLRETVYNNLVVKVIIFLLLWERSLEVLNVNNTKEINFYNKYGNVPLGLSISI